MTNFELTRPGGDVRRRTIGTSSQPLQEPRSKASLGWAVIGRFLWQFGPAILAFGTALVLAWQNDV